MASFYTKVRNAAEDTVATTVGLGVGGASGANVGHNIATGQSPIQHAQGAAALDIAGLGAGVGLTLGGPAAAVNPETIGSAGAPATFPAAATGGTMSTLSSVATMLSAGASIGATLFGVRAAKRAAGAPDVTPPVTMPTADSPIVRTAQQNSIAEQVLRRGRASTFLTQPSESLGA